MVPSIVARRVVAGKVGHSAEAGDTIRGYWRTCSKAEILRLQACLKVLAADSEVSVAVLMAGGGLGLLGLAQCWPDDNEKIS